MIVTYPLNGIEYTADDAETYLCTRTSGVFSADISITPENMTVTIGRFLAWIKNDDFKGKSVVVTEPVTLSIDSAEAVLKRIDRIVLRFESSKNVSDLIVLKGTASSSPVAPEIAKTAAVYDLCLADVTVNAGVTSLSAADITSQILNEDLCGIMRDGVTGIPTAQLQEQVEELIERLHTAISGVETESAFLMSEIYDPNGKAKEVAFADEVLLSDDGTTTRKIPYNNVDGIITHVPGDTTHRIIFYGGDAIGTGASLYLCGANQPSFPGIFGLYACDGNTRTELLGYAGGDLKWNAKALFGLYNKPSGTYTGNGSTSNREITVGDDNTVGTTLVITSSKASALITKNGGIVCGYDPTGEDVLGGTRETTFDGKKLIAEYAMLLNESGIKYTYYVL